MRRLRGLQRLGEEGHEYQAEENPNAHGVVSVLRLQGLPRVEGVIMLVVYLANAASGINLVDRFIEGYAKYDAGTEHRLLIARKGDVKVHIPIGACKYGVFQTYVPPSGFDIGTYVHIAANATEEFVCFLNSYSRPQSPGWLERLLFIARQPGVGVAGCTGSLECNPHIRTNAFCMRRKLFLEIAPEHPSRQGCLDFEHGERNMTQQICSRGLTAEVVGANPYEPSWRDSNTFRWGEQRSLLVADNRTDDYQYADHDRKQWLQRLAWGASE